MDLAVKGFVVHPFRLVDLTFLFSLNAHFSHEKSIVIRLNIYQTSPL